MDLLVTNNPLTKAECRDGLECKLLNTDLHGVLIYVRDLIHKGHRLLTHPMSGSIKPNETPYKSVLISGNPGKTDSESVRIIEECIQTVQKFPPKQTSQQDLKDMQIIDHSLIKPALDNIIYN